MFKLPKKYEVVIGMKSGNTIVLENVKKFDIEKKEGQVVSLSWDFHDTETRILNINPTEVESVIAYASTRYWFN